METYETEPDITDTEPDESETDPTESETEPTETEPTESETEPTEITETIPEPTDGSTSFFDTLELNSVENWLIFLEGSWSGSVPWYSIDGDGNSTLGGYIDDSFDLQTVITAFTTSQEVDPATGNLIAYYIEGTYMLIEKIDTNTIRVTQSDHPEDSYILVRD